MFRRFNYTNLTKLYSKLFHALQNICNRIRRLRSKQVYEIDTSKLIGKLLVDVFAYVLKRKVYTSKLQDGVELGKT